MFVCLFILCVGRLHEAIEENLREICFSFFKVKWTCSRPQDKGGKAEILDKERDIGQIIYVEENKGLNIAADHLFHPSCSL